jgi:hypothetical protein
MVMATAPLWFMILAGILLIGLIATVITLFIIKANTSAIINGLRGEKGDPGVPGLKGTNGAPGVPGKTGETGPAGTNTNLWPATGADFFTQSLELKYATPTISGSTIISAPIMKPLNLVQTEHS